MGEAAGVRIGNDVGYDDAGAGPECFAHPARVRQADRRIGRHHPDRLDPAVVDRFEHVDRLEAWFRGDVGRAPEAADPIHFLRCKAHVRRQRRSEPAHFAAAHRVGLAGDREGAGARLADAARGEMQVQDRIDLVGALDRLVHALAEHRQGAWIRKEQGCQRAQTIGIEVAVLRGSLQPSLLLDPVPEAVRDGHMGSQIGFIDLPPAPRLGQQVGEQGDVAPRADREVEIGALRGLGPARVDHHQLHVAFRARSLDPLPDDRMAPGRIGADQDDEVGRFDIVVAGRHDILTEAADVTGDSARHAEARVGVDVGGADEALHQLVGDIIIFGEQLAGDVESDAVRSVLRNGFSKAVRDEGERLVPARPPLADHRVEQPSLQAERLAEMRALRAQLAAVGRMVRVACNGDAAVLRDARLDAAADAAIGAGRADRVHERFRPPRPALRRRLGRSGCAPRPHAPE